MAAPVLQFKRGAYSNLPALKAGEPGFTTDKYDLYVGLDNNSANNKFFGSHRYWTRETASAGSGINLVESTNGTDYVTLRAPASVGAAVTYVFPGTQGAVSSVLTNDGSGNLSWSSGSSNPVFTGIATFNTDQVDINSTVDISGITTISSTADSTNKDTGSLVLEGGLGVEKNVHIGAGLSVTTNLYVGGESEFIGVVTFRGGTINLGDSGTDDVVIGGEFASNLIPTTNVSYDLGSSSKRWADIYARSLDLSGNLNVTGFSTFNGLVVGNNGINVSGFSTIYNLQILNNLFVDGSFEVDTLLTAHGNAIFSGITSFTGTTQSTNYDNGLLVIDGGVGIQKNLNVGGDFNVTGNAYVSGVTTFVGAIAGTASTATTVDTTATTTNSDFFVPFVDTYAGQTGETVRVGAGLSVNPSTGEVKTAGTLSVGSPTATTSYIKAGGGSNAMYLFGNGDVSFQSKVITNSIRSQSNSNNTISLADIDATFARNVSIAGIATVTGEFVTGADILVGGNDIKASDGNTNITLTSNTLTTFAGDIKVGGNDIQSSGGTTVLTLSGADVTVAGDITVGGNDIKASDGTTAITLTAATGAVGVSSNLTVSGNLYVLGSSTEVNTETLKVEDSLIEVGLVNSGGSLVPPSSDLNIDVGVIFHYYTASAKKAGVYWDDSVSRVVISSDLTETSSVITSSTYAALEIGSLWVTDCAGTSQVINCSGSTRTLENITVDGGSF